MDKTNISSLIFLYNNMFNKKFRVEIPDDIVNKFSDKSKRMLNKLPKVINFLERSKVIPRSRNPYSHVWLYLTIMNVYKGKEQFKIYVPYDWEHEYNLINIIEPYVLKELELRENLKIEKEKEREMIRNKKEEEDEKEIRKMIDSNNVGIL